MKQSPPLTSSLLIVQKTAVAVAHVKRGNGMIRLNGIAQKCSDLLSTYN